MLDELPEKKQPGGQTIETSGKKKPVAAAENAGKSLNMNENLFKLKEDSLRTEIRNLEEQKIKHE